MSWQPWLEDRVLRQMQGLPPEAFDLVVQTLAQICDDPYDPVSSTPVPPIPGRRVADRGNLGFIEFIADKAKGLGPYLLPGVDRLAISPSQRPATSLTDAQDPVEAEPRGSPRIADMAGI